MGDVYQEMPTVAARVGWFGRIVLVAIGVVSFVTAGASAYQWAGEGDSSFGPVSYNPNADLLQQIAQSQSETRTDVSQIKAIVAEEKKTEPQVTPEALREIDNSISRALEQMVSVRRGGEYLPIEQRDSFNANVETVSQILTAARNRIDQLLRPSTKEAGEGPLLLSMTAPPVTTMEPDPYGKERIKFYAVLVILVTLGATFIIAAIALFTARSDRTFAVAADTIKTLIGFFTGVSATFLSS